VLALCVGTQNARADDVVRLGGTGNAQTVTLGFDGQAGTELVRRGGFGGYRGGFGGYRGGYAGYRGGYGGYRGGYAGFRGGYGGYRGYAGYRGYYGGHRGYYAGYRGFYGGYRGFYGGYRGYYRPFYGYRAFYRPYFWGSLYGGYAGYPGYGVYGYGYPSFYGNGGYGYPSYGYDNSYGYSPGYYGGYPCPIATTVITTPAVGVPYSGAYGIPNMPAPGAALPDGSGDGTYPYDGGPSDPLPMPKADTGVPPPPAPVKDRRPVVPAKGSLLVSYPPSPPAAAPARQPVTGGFAYPAYGEDTRANSFATDRTRKTSTGRSGR